MAWDNFCTHQPHKVIKRSGEEALADSICLPLKTHAVNDITTAKIRLQHLAANLNIILKISIHGNTHIHCLGYSLKTGNKCRLMALVAGKAKPTDAFTRGGKGLNQGPSRILTAIIYEKYTGSGRVAKASNSHVPQLAEQA